MPWLVQFSKHRSLQHGVLSSNVTHQAEKVLKKLRTRRALLCIVGLGYVGLPLSSLTPKLAISVGQIGRRKRAISQGQSYIKHIDGERVAEAIHEKRFEATTDFARAAEADALILCVPTPLNQYREPDLSFIRATMAALLPYLRPGQVLSLESTTYPGTTEEELRPLVEQQGLVIGESFFLVYSPEREDPGNAHFNTATIPKVLGGSTPACNEVGGPL